MMIRWMIYLGLLIFAAYESVVFENAAVTMFFVAALLLFVLLLLLLLIQRQMLKVSMKIPVPAAEKNKGVQLLFRLGVFMRKLFAYPILQERKRSMP